MEEWELVEVSFHAVYGVDLESVFRVKSWRWFMVRVRGLLASDCPLSRRFAPKPVEVPDE